MGSLYRLGQKFVDFCNVVQQNVNNALTVPSSKVLFDKLSPQITNDILVDAEAQSNDEICFYRCSGSSYTGTIPSTGNWTYCSAMVVPRGAGRIAVWFNDDDIAMNRYSGSAWTGWTQMTHPVDYSSQVTKTAGQTSDFYCYKIGRVVYINSISDSTTWTNGKALMTLPAACRPIKGVYTYAHANSGNADYGMSVYIPTNGQVVVYPENTTTAFRCCFFCSFIAAS